MINKKTILFVDGYNIINAWSDLKKLLEYDLEGSREKLNDYMYEYAAYYGEEVWVIYDAYQTSSKKENIDKINGIHIVYTKEKQTADAYIEKAVKDCSNDRRILVKIATSDWVQQRQVLGSGGIRMTPHELKEKCSRIRRKIDMKYNKKYGSANDVGSSLNSKSLKILSDLLKDS